MEQKEILAKFFLRERTEKDKDYQRLNELDDLWDKVYADKSGISFSEARLKANLAVIEDCLELQNK